MTQQMNSIRFDRFGGPEVLHPAVVDVPQPGAGQVRVRVTLVGLNPVDAKIRAGELPELPPLPHVPGSDVVGVVDAVGDGAPYAVGDQVFGWSDTGAYAEYALATTVLRLPAELAPEDAVTLPVPGEAALRGLRLLDPVPGEVLLVHGATGAVGSIAVQVALERGITVVGTGHPDRLDEVKALGAMPVAYGDGLVDRVRALTPRIDAVLDAAGYGVLPDAITLRGGDGRILTVADPAAFDMGIPFSSGTVSDRTIEVLVELADHVVAGRVRVPRVRAFPLAEAAQAQQLCASGHARAKVVLTVP